MIRILRNGLKPEVDDRCGIEEQIRQLEYDYGLIVQRQESVPLKDADAGSNPAKSTICEYGDECK